MRRIVGEFIGTALLLAAIVGSGIMGERLADGSVAVMLLANSVATGAALTALMLSFGPISGAHFNPAVSFAEAARGAMGKSLAYGYAIVQVAGAILGVGLANYMFGEPLYAWSSRARTGLPQWCSEAVATFGLLATIMGALDDLHTSSRSPSAPTSRPQSWFTASTSFANPAVTIARALTDTVTGIRPSDVSMFVLAQIVGATMATAQFHWLVPPTPTPPVARS